MTCLYLVKNVGAYPGKLGKLTSTESRGLAVSLNLLSDLLDEAMMDWF
jgi:hypothetical protein